MSLRKVEYNKSNPLPLSYGRGNGFKPGLGRGNSGDKRPVEILFVQGGDRNIDRSKYPVGETLRAISNGCLLLPVGQTIAYDGEHFEGEDAFNSANARHYQVDDLGLSIRNIDKEPTSMAEDSLDRPDDYPKRIGTISKVEEVDKAKNFYDIIDNSIPANLNYEDYLIGEEQMTIIFQSGELAGREFDVRYYHETKTANGKTKVGQRFEIVPQEIDGVMMPGESFVPHAGDTYAVFHVMLPDAYIQDDATKSGASWDMFRAAVKYLFDNEEQKFTFKGELDGIWAKKDWINIGGKIRPGGFVRYTGEGFEREGVLVRITAVKDYINNPHAPKIELSNETVSGSVSSTIKRLESTEVVAEEYHRDAIQFTKRRFRDAKETIEMIENALSDNFTNRINPIAVEAMSLLVGDERLQYQFVAAPGSTEAVPHNITWNGESKRLTAPAGTIQHLTVGIASISPSHQAHEYHYWNIEHFESASLEDGTTKYYLYIRAQKGYNGNAGSAVFRLETNAHKLEEGNYYWFLVGVLNTEYDGERSFVTLYGFTEVLPGRITADKIAAADGESYFDMRNAALKLKDNLMYNVNGNRKLILQGTLVQSESGDISPLGVYRGIWDENVVYYQNDEVTYAKDGATATYRYINPTPGKAHLPTNSHYWTVSAKGKDGDSVKIDTQSVTYQASDNGTEPPHGEWLEAIPEVPDGGFLWAKTEITYTNGKSTVSYSVSRHGKSVAVRKTGTKYVKGKGLNAQPADSEFDNSALMAPGALAQGDWLWSRTTVEYTDGTLTKSYSCSLIGTDGAQGQPGTPGKDGNQAYIHFAYASYIDGTLPHPTSVVGFSVSPFVGARYIGIYSDSSEQDSPNHADYDWSVYSSAGYAPNLLNGTANGKFNWDVAAYAPAGSDDDIVRVPLSAWNCKQPYMAAGYTGIGVTVGGRNLSGCTVYFKSKWHLERGNTYTLSFSLIAGGAITQFDIYLGRGPGWGDMVTNFVRLSRPQGALSNRYAVRLTANEKAATPAENLYVIFNFSDSFKNFPANTGIEIADLKLEENTNDNPVWTPSADDLAGKPGDYTENRYAVNGSKTVPPALAATTRNPTGWTVAQPEVSALQYLWLTQARINGSSGNLLTDWSEPVRITPYDGTDGANAPMMVFRGAYDPSKTYYGNPERADVVRYGSHYYVASTTAGTLMGVTPVVGSNWNDFGAEFESVATNFMLAEHAAIGNWAISGDNIVSTHGKVDGVESDDFENPLFVPDVILDGATGKLTFGKDMELTRNGLTLLSDGYQKLRVVNCSLGEYNKNMLKSGGAIELAKTQTSSVEIVEIEDVTTGAVTRHDAILEAEITENLGFMSFGSVIDIKKFSISFTVPDNGSSAVGPTVEVVSSGMAALKVQILRDGQVVKEAVSEVAGAYTSGQLYKAEGGALFHKIPDGAEGGYSIKVVTNGIFVSSVNTGRIDITHTLKLSGTFNKNNFDQNVLANDGFLSCWGGSTAIYARKGKVINKAGAYELHVDANEGIYKIENGEKTML